MTKLSRKIIITISAIIIIICTLAIYYSNVSIYEAVYSNSNPEKTYNITRMLTENGISSRSNDDGTIISVQSKDLEKAKKISGNNFKY